jgi:hypothetical protein
VIRRIKGALSLDRWNIKGYDMIPLINKILLALVLIIILSYIMYKPYTSNQDGFIDFSKSESLALNMEITFNQIKSYEAQMNKILSDVNWRDILNSNGFRVKQPSGFNLSYVIDATNGAYLCLWPQHNTIKHRNIIVYVADKVKKDGYDIVINENCGSLNNGNLSTLATYKATLWIK